MPIKNTIEGDLIKLAKEGRYNGIAHGANIWNAMGSGIAPQIANAFPSAEIADKCTIAGDNSKLGTITHGSQLHPKGFMFDIFNLYTQAEFGRPANGVHNVNYKAVANCFHTLNTNLKKEEGYLLGIPAIGSGLAKGHWEAIEVIINLCTPDLFIELVRYKP